MRYIFIKIELRNERKKDKDKFFLLVKIYHNLEIQNEALWGVPFLLWNATWTLEELRVVYKSHSLQYAVLWFLLEVAKESLIKKKRKKEKFVKFELSNQRTFEITECMKEMNWTNLNVTLQQHLYYLQRFSLFC